MQELKICKLCGKLLVWFEGCGFLIKDLVPGGHNPNLCRKCENEVIMDFLEAKGIHRE